MSGSRAEWLAWRKQGITATTAACVAGRSPYGSPWSAWAELVGLIDHTDEPSEVMVLGSRLEPAIAGMFHEDTGLYVIGFQHWAEHPDEPWMRATVDGFAAESPKSRIGDALAGVEMKFTGERMSAWDTLPDHIVVQCQWQMLVTGLDLTYVPTIHRDGFRIHEVVRDEPTINLLIDVCSEFWHTNVLGGVAPAVDAHQATTDALRDAFVADDTTVEADDNLANDVRQLQALKAEMKELDDHLTLMENQIKAALGDATTLTYDGKPLVTWKPQDRRGFDSKRLLLDHPDIANQYTTTTTSRVLRVATPKGADK